MKTTYSAVTAALQKFLTSNHRSTFLIPYQDQKAQVAAFAKEPAELFSAMFRGKFKGDLKKVGAEVWGLWQVDNLYHALFAIGCYVAGKKEKKDLWWDDQTDEQTDRVFQRIKDLL